MINDKFSVLKEFRELSSQKEIPLTLSVGVAYGWNDFPVIGKVALNNLELAQVRGGDQVVLRENTPQARPVYFGGNSESRTQKAEQEHGPFQQHFGQLLPKQKMSLL
jgi:cyclic-di-AMP phosphodiesterase